MDLSTMGAKLEAGMYKDRFAFEADFRLILSNAKKYNLPGSHVYNETVVIENFFEKRACRLLNASLNILHLCYRMGPDSENTRDRQTPAPCSNPVSTPSCSTSCECIHFWSSISQAQGGR